MPKIKSRKILFASIGIPIFLLVTYMAVSAYFKDHFYYGTVINCVNVSGKTEEEANVQLAAQQENYNLELDELNGVKEKILAKEIGLKYTLHDEVKAIKDNQNPFMWINGFFKGSDNSLKTSTNYDESLLKKRIDSLSCFDEKKVVSPKDAALKYNGKTYEIEKEIDGNKVNKEALHDKILQAISSGKTSINLEKTQCYYKPKYTAGNKEVVEAKSTVNKYLSSEIKYNLDDRSEVLNSSKTNEWVIIDAGFKVKLDEEKVRAYIGSIARSYDVIGKTIDFKNSDGNMIKINDRNYKKVINRNKEVEELISALKEGKNITRQPILTIINTPEIGSTYVEVDFTKQCIWFYKNGTLITKGDVVTGNISNGNATPDGIYKLTYKQKDAVLKGPGYAAPVGFWMPFNGGIGIHDATWRKTFGGEIYKTDGSHGCINAPYGIAEAIFNNIDAGTTIVCHY